MKTLLVLPTYSMDEPGRRVSRMVEKAQERNKSLDILSLSSSFLTYNFNNLWCYALNHPQYTHWCMLHADILPKADDWLERMLQVTEESGADIMSCVVPIKNHMGLTSTALEKAGAEFGDFRRLTMTELMTMPPAFSRGKLAQLFGWEGETVLLANTGLMVVKMRRANVLARMVFQTRNWIRRDGQGNYYGISEPEDWNWARQAHEHGLDVWVTRAVPVRHLGEGEFDNDRAWGTVEHDQGDKALG